MLLGGSCNTQQLQYNNAAPAASGTSHFLFASLSHSSLPVRRAAARMIMHNLHRIQQRQKMTKKEDEDGEGKEEKDDSSSKSKSVAVVRNSGQGLQEVLVILLHSLMFGELPYEQQQQSSQCNTLQQHQMMSVMELILECVERLIYLCFIWDLLLQVFIKENAKDVE